jgi:chromosome condensin MukBEF MukE localization factor
VFVKEKIEEFIAIKIMIAQAQRLYPKLDSFDPNCQHIAFLNSHVKSFFKQFKNTDMRTF